MTTDEKTMFMMKVGLTPTFMLTGLLRGSTITNGDLIIDEIKARIQRGEQLVGLHGMILYKEILAHNKRKASSINVIGESNDQNNSHMSCDSGLKDSFQYGGGI